MKNIIQKRKCGQIYGGRSPSRNYVSENKMFGKIFHFYFVASSKSSTYRRVYSSFFGMTDSTSKASFSAWTPGQYAWEISDVFYIKPFPIKGKLKFFDADFNLIEYSSRSIPCHLWIMRQGICYSRCEVVQYRATALSAS